MTEAPANRAQKKEWQRLCVFTGTRAEYGLLKPLIQAIAASPGLELRLLVTGGHLASSQGSTWREIAADGFCIDERVEIVLDADTAAGVATSMGLGTMRFAEALGRLRLDAILILGDRFEALAAASAAVVCGVPIVHLHGGEVTLGAIDEVFRHAITKMSRLHFTSTARYRERVIQLGEHPSTVFHVGALGVANALAAEPLDRATVLSRLGLPEGSRYLLATFHPATTDHADPAGQVAELTGALDEFPHLHVVFSGANADAGGRTVNDAVKAYAAREPHRVRFSQSLGASLFLSAVRHAEAVIGNSSSGIIEAPSLRVPTVDIGSRQSGRVRGESVIAALPKRHAIAAALAKALSPDFRRLAASASNPYEHPATVATIVKVIEATDFSNLPPKSFYDLPSSA